MHMLLQQTQATTFNTKMLWAVATVGTWGIPSTVLRACQKHGMCVALRGFSNSLHIHLEPLEDENEGIFALTLSRPAARNAIGAYLKPPFKVMTSDGTVSLQCSWIAYYGLPMSSSEGRMLPLPCTSKRGFEIRLAHIYRPPAAA